MPDTCSYVFMQKIHQNMSLLVISPFSAYYYPPMDKALLVGHSNATLPWDSIYMCLYTYTRLSETDLCEKHCTWKLRYFQVQGFIGRGGGGGGGKTWDIPPPPPQKLFSPPRISTTKFQHYSRMFCAYATYFRMAISTSRMPQNQSQSFYFFKNLGCAK